MNLITQSNMNNLSFLFIVLILPKDVFAHHPLNGEIMENFNDGFLSGIGHPILGLDHLLFIIGVGLISFLSKRFLNFSFTFIGGTILGLVSMIWGLYLPFYEIMISFTLLLLGYLILATRQIRYDGLLFTLFGVFHGWAYGAIFSNDVKLNIDVLFGYSLGLLLTQLTIVILGFKLFSYLNRFKSNNISVVPVFSGIIIGVASVSLFEIFESSILSLFY